MSVTNFIPTIWSENLLQSLNQHYVGVANCNREYEGEIKEMGSSVKICGISSMNIKNYTKNSDMDAPQDVNSFFRELVIDQTKYFNFQIDDVDRAQAIPSLMDCALKTAANELAKQADSYVFRLAENAGIQMEFSDITEENVMNSIITARQRLYSNGVMDNTEVVLEISPAIASALYKAKLSLCTNNHEILENGCIGKVAGCKVFVSNNLVTGGEGDAEFFDCIMRTKRAIAFAEQLSEIVAYCPEKRFADAVKGLHLYGGKVIYPNEIVRLRLLLPEVVPEE